MLACPKYMRCAFAESKSESLCIVRLVHIQRGNKFLNKIQAATYYTPIERSTQPFAHLRAYPIPPLLYSSGVVFLLQSNTRIDPKIVLVTNRHTDHSSSVITNRPTAAFLYRFVVLGRIRVISYYTSPSKRQRKHIRSEDKS